MMNMTKQAAQTCKTYLDAAGYVATLVRRGSGNRYMVIVSATWIGPDRTATVNTPRDLNGFAGIPAKAIEELT